MTGDGPTGEEAAFEPFSGPPGDVVVPDVVARLAGGRPTRAVWLNELDGLTFALGAPGTPEAFVKWSPPDGPDLDHEVERLRWARTHARVPQVLDAGRDAGASWMLTAALPGRSAVDPVWLADPGTAVTAIGAGLRLLHDALPVAGPDACPFDWSAPARVADAHARAADLDPAGWHPDHRHPDHQHPDHQHPDHRHRTVASALAAVADPPPVDRLVVCHGDACAPNTLVADDGTAAGHVDLGALGTADRWADLAVATWSTVWNYGPGWEEPLLEAYGVAPDPERTAYYRLLWDLGP